MKLQLPCAMENRSYVARYFKPEFYTPKSALDEGERTRNFILALKWVICIYLVR